MQKRIFLPILFGGFIRYLLTFTKWITFFGNHIEISTPLNSLKRVKEGVYLLQKGIDPYSGDVVHEMPVILLMFVEVYKYLPQFVPLIFTLLDLLTAYVLHELVQQVVRLKLKEQKLEVGSYAKNTEDLQWQFKDISNLSLGVLYMYLFNPLSIMNCVAQVSTVFSNLFLALTLYFLCHRKLIPCLLCLSVETMKNLYPVVLIAPILLTFSKRKNGPSAITVALLFTGICLKICALNFYIVKSWSFFDGTLGFIFFYRDLQPNIGLFWYFFTEMFDHFRTMFLITFQMNATVLYLMPLTLKLRKEPMLLATVLIALVTIFRSYPCLGDVSLYLALLPLWRRSRKFMAHNFVVLCFFAVTLCMMPVLWHLWIYAGSANANFYFGTTLAFCTGQIFLVTDLLFAYVKRQFCLLNGEKIYIDGKEAKIILE